MFDIPGFQEELETIAAESGRPVQVVRSEAQQGLDEMRGERRDMAVSVFARLSRYMCRRGYHPDYYYDVAELERVRKLAVDKSVVYLVTA
jgi:hypothetical protein